MKRLYTLADAGHSVTLERLEIIAQTRTHTVLHDIPAAHRARVVEHLSRKLAAGGRLFIREPIQPLPREETVRLMQQNGLREIASSLAQVPLMGATSEGVFSRD